MADLLLVLLFLAVGSLGGFLAGLLGVGGGLIFIPVIDWFIRPVVYADIPTNSSEELVRFTLANSIALVFLSGVSGIYRQIKSGNYLLKESLAIGIPGAIAAASVNYLIHVGDWYDKQRFQCVFLAFLLISIYNMLFGKKETQSQPMNDSENSSFKGMGVGILAGATVSLSGLGGGIIMVPLFRMILKKPMHLATSLSLSIVPLLSFLPLFQNLALSHPQELFTDVRFLGMTNIWQTGYIIWPMFIPMALGVLVFSSFGQKTAPKVPVRWLRIIFALLSTIILIKTLYELFQKA